MLPLDCVPLSLVAESYNTVFKKLSICKLLIDFLGSH